MGVVAANIVIGNITEQKQDQPATTHINMAGRSIREILSQMQQVEEVIEATEVVEEPVNIKVAPVVNKKTSRYLQDIFNGSDLISFDK